MPARKPQPIRFDVRIRVGQYSDGDIPGFLDMLRYEGGRVISWERDDQPAPSGARIGYRVTIEVDSEYRFQPDRWRSFGIYPTVVR